MKKMILLLVCAIVLSACKHQSKQDVVVEQGYGDTSTVECVDTTTKKTLNDIRFAGWEYEDWLDNDYIRELRLYINDYLSGEIEDVELDEYREEIKGKFVIVNIVPFVMGGTQIYFSFMDYPSKVFTSWYIAQWMKRTKWCLNISVRGFRMLAKSLATPKRKSAKS